MKLFFRHFGKGWPLVIVHGLYGSSDNWLSVAKKLENHFSLYLVDLRNHGNSPHSEEHSYQAMSQDLKDFILENNIKSPILMGHSMGGKVVMHLGLSNPELIQRMIVVDISPLGNINAPHKQHMLDHKNIISSLRNLPIKIIESRKEADTILSERVPSERVRSFLLKNLTRVGHQFQWKLNLDILATQIEHVMDGFDLSNPDHLSQKDFPILFIKGNKSDYIGKEDESAIKLFYPESKIENIPEAGHWVHAEQLDLFIETVMNFCNQEASF